MKTSSATNGEVLAAAAESLKNYRDGVRYMSPEERQRYQGQVLAVLCETGQIIAAAPTPDELSKAVAASPYDGRPWRMTDGPGTDPPLTVEEFTKLHGDS
ncbi:MAG TPA: hypothetical protein VFI31_14690 [Pirellulales bacterium]|nr:hypothetical protein [Pirellulales bacterium]